MMVSSPESSWRTTNKHIPQGTSNVALQHRQQYY